MKINIKTIPLTLGKLAFVDDEDYELLSKFKWYAVKDRGTYYAVRQLKRVNGKQKRIRMHTEIIGNKNGYVVDHINGDGVDNRRVNLRHLTIRQNGQNRRVLKSSKYPGVSWSTKSLKWHAGVVLNGKRRHLGYYSNETDAFLAYKVAVNELAGEDVIMPYNTALVNRINKQIGNE